MDFTLDKLDNAIYLYMHDKPNTMVDLNQVYTECLQLCPELKNHNMVTFNSYLNKALQEYPKLQLFKSKLNLTNPVFELPGKKYLIYWENFNQNVTLSDEKNSNYDVVQHGLNLEEKNKNLVCENKLLSDQCIRLMNENTELTRQYNGMVKDVNTLKEELRQLQDIYKKNLESSNSIPFTYALFLSMILTLSLSYFIR